MTAFFLPLILLSGCKVTDAPDSLEELVVYGFVNFDHDNAGVLETTVAKLAPLVDTFSDDLADGVRVDELKNADLTAAGVDAADVEGIVGALGRVQYSSSLDDVLEITTHLRKDTLFDTVDEYEVIDQTDRACFLAHECDRFEQTLHEVTQIPLLGVADRTFTNQLRWVQTDNGEAVVIRSISPDPVEFNSNIVKVNQQYAFVVLENDGSGTRRIESFWVDAEIIGLNVPDNYAVNSAVNSMADQAVRIDEVIAAQ